MTEHTPGPWTVTDVALHKMAYQDELVVTGLRR